MKKWLILVFLLIDPVCYAQSATINWTKVDQVIDGFGAHDGFRYPMSAAQVTEVFGTTGTELGASILSTPEGDGTGAVDPDDCSIVSSGCQEFYASDITGAASYGARVIGVVYGFPAAYTTNGSESCTGGSGNGTLAPGQYQDFANWEANFVQSVKNYSGVTLYGMAVQNEPEYCESGEHFTMSGSAFDTYIKNYMGPTFKTDGLGSTLIVYPTANYDHLSSFSNCATDSSCAPYVGAFAYHDYDTTSTEGTPGTVSSTPYPAGWAAGKKFWQEEVSCQGSGSDPNFCNGTFDPSWTNAMDWASVMDQRLAVDNVSMWNYWWFYVEPSPSDGSGLIQDSCAKCGDVVTVAGRAYVFAQYARFVRPGYYRIDATHVPQSGVSVSAYENTSSGTLVIVATNYTASPILQTFSITNAPTFTSVKPYISSATQDIQAQVDQSVSSNSFGYTLPAKSVTTFVAASSGSTAPAPPTNLQVTVN
jgi:O-glycosyl hydrolase